MGIDVGGTIIVTRHTKYAAGLAIIHISCHTHMYYQVWRDESTSELVCLCVQCN